ncbi:MAG: hypothetical protein AB8H47_17955 [Bacteroidia bacterium]
MVSSYFLELWISPASSASVKKLLQIPIGKERSLLRLFETHEADEPSVFAVNAVMDQWEELLPQLLDAGLEDYHASIWLDGKYDLSFGLGLDPMSLMRLGQERLRLCLNGERQTAAAWEVLDPSLSSLAVAIQYIFVDKAGDDDLPYVAGPVPVTVGFDDGTIWQARFVPMPYLNRVQKEQRGFFWEPDMILVPFVNQKEVEKSILTLMRQQKFEQAFTNIEEDFAREIEVGQSIFELQIIREGIQDIPLAEIFNISRTNISVDQQFWRWRNVQYHQQNCFDYLHHYQELIQQHYPSLKKLGIQRQDISINLQYRYQGSCNLELHPETLLNLGRHGISLQLNCKQAARAVARSLE